MFAGEGGDVGGQRLDDGAPAPDRTSEDAVIEALAADITAFTREHGLARTVVVNVASTEPQPAA
ncbi:hypothetical protein [Streptomyces albus]|uniref:hypothetical protein n=1 Tax=Streptomyces albus TaxID=1888 RepID=UPI000A713C9B